MFEVITPSVSSSSKLPVGRCPQIDLKSRAQDGADIQKDIFKPLQLQGKKDIEKYFALG
jgi:hypothetical protein